MFSFLISVPVVIFQKATGTDYDFEKWCENEMYYVFHIKISKLFYR